MGLISKEIQFSAGNINQLESNGTIEVVITGKSITLTMEDVEISKILKDGWLLIQTE
jgi:isoleucyl-tRNA synthetase